MLNSYKKLLSKARDLTLWETIKLIMAWDYETKMPPGGMIQRSMQMALIEQLLHQGGRTLKSRHCLPK
jgi:Zn-dependent M32 family carboxypeptidase